MTPAHTPYRKQFLSAIASLKASGVNVSITSPKREYGQTLRGKGEYAYAFALETQPRFFAPNGLKKSFDIHTSSPATRDAVLSAMSKHGVKAMVQYYSSCDFPDGSPKSVLIEQTIEPDHGAMNEHDMEAGVWLATPGYA